MGSLCPGNYPLRCDSASPHSIDVGPHGPGSNFLVMWWTNFDLAAHENLGSRRPTGDHRADVTLPPVGLFGHLYSGSPAQGRLERANELVQVRIINLYR
jgi:hypothetical protein